MTLHACISNSPGKGCCQPKTESRCKELPFLKVVIQSRGFLQGLACEDKRAAANIEHRQQTLLAALERTLAEVTKNSEAVQAKIGELTAQHSQLEGQAAEIASRCGQLSAQEEAVRRDIAAVIDQKHQARLLLCCPENQLRFAASHWCSATC